MYLEDDIVKKLIESMLYFFIYLIRNVYYNKINIEKMLLIFI